MSYEFILSEIIPASPTAIYDAWLDSRGHSQMTGGKAKMSARAGGKYTAWDGYISGKNLKLVPGKTIIQSWRTTNFTKDDSYSVITVTLLPVTGGTRLTLKHSDVPDGHTSYEKGGWHDHYFKPMKKYFSKKTKAPQAPKKVKAVKRRKVAKKSVKRKATKRR